MKNLGLYIGSLSTAGLGVDSMVNFNPFTISFWAALTGIAFFAMIGGMIGSMADDTILKKPMEKLIELCHSIGRKYLKG